MSLQRACCINVNNQDAALAMDQFHLAAVAALTDLGLQKPSKELRTHENRPTFPKCKQQMKDAVQTARAHAKLDPSKFKEVWAAIKIKQTIEATAETVDSAALTRKHHRIAMSNPKKLADIIWGRAMGSEPPDCSKEACEAYFTEVYKAATPPIATPSWLPPQRLPLPLAPLTVTPETIRRALRKKGSGKNSPGLDGITYALLLKLAWAPTALAGLFNGIICQQKCPETWRYGVTVLLHKGGEKSLQNYRPITLTPTIAKLFHSIVASWLERALTATKAIPTTIQKGFLMGISGAIEHDMVLDAALAEAKRHRKNLYMVLVDLKNAFGSVPHTRIAWALQRFGAPDWVRNYVADFYGSVHSQIHSKSWDTRFLQVSRGVLQGDTLSPLLFLMVMQVALDGLTATCPGYGFTTVDGHRHFLKCFADDLTIIATTPKQLQLATKKLEQITEWLGLEIKPSKCRSFGMSKRSYQKINIDIYGQTILNIEDAPSKFLGMQLSLTQSFKEKAAIAEKALYGILQPLIDVNLPPRDKVALYKSFAIPKMRWVLLVQDVLPTALQRITRKLEQHLKQWWHLPRSTSRNALRLATGIPSISDLAEQSQCTKYSVAKNSTDPSVAAVLFHRRAIRHKPLNRLLKSLGGSIPADKRAAMKMIKAEQRIALKDKVAALVVQGAWCRLNQELAADRQWRSVMWSLPQTVQQFATKAAIDVLPTRANLLRWKVGCDSSCTNCGVKETLHHILNNCAHLLNNGAYKWRHDSILLQIATAIKIRLPNSQIIADIPGYTYRLPFSCDTNWRPDIIIYNSDHTIEFVELTVPFEPNTASAHTRKTTKYGNLLQCAKAEGLKPTLSCIEMGSRGIPSPAWQAWTKTNRLHPNLTKTCASIALKASHVIWLHKGTTWPNPPPMEVERHDRGMGAPDHDGAPHHPANGGFVVCSL